VKDVILIGRREKILEASAENWRKHLADTQHHSSTRLSFMTSDHHLIRNFVVRELPSNHGKPLSAEDISNRLQLPLTRVGAILDDLERHLFFLVRNDAGQISWAFPVTAETTPHRLSFSSGERTFAA
jgi:hypothetical protein